MLELLAGPFPLLYDGEPKQIELWVGYHDSTGFIGNVKIDGVTGRGCVIALDGTIYPRNNQQVQGRMGFNFKTKGLCVNDDQDGHTHFYDVMDLHMLRGQGDYVDHPVLALGYSVFSDRRLRGVGGVIVRFDETADPTFEVEEYDFGAGAVLDPAVAHFSPGPRDDQCFVAWNSGRIYLYDHVSKTLADPVVRRIDPCIAAHYSRHLGVFVSVHEEEDTHVIRIWADEHRPHELADPEEISAVFPGAVFRARTRLLGEHGEPCAGHNVAWTTDVGTVLDPVTQTDADGYASTRILLPVDESAESIDVTATVKF